jgi:hypothetical protein
MRASTVQSGRHTTTTITFHNTGRSAATLVAAGFSIKKVDVLPPYSAEQYRDAALPQGRKIGPTRGFSLQIIDPDSVTQDEQKQIEKTTLQYFVYGYFEYRDVFNANHVTVFCGDYSPTDLDPATSPPTHRFSSCYATD